jgi:hypothetical protein
MVHTLEQATAISEANKKKIRKVVRIGGTPAIAYTYNQNVYFTFDFIEQKWNCGEEMVNAINEFLK